MTPNQLYYACREQEAKNRRLPIVVLSHCSFPWHVRNHFAEYQRHLDHFHLKGFVKPERDSVLRN